MSLEGWPVVQRSRLHGRGYSWPGSTQSVPSPTSGSVSTGQGVPELDVVAGTDSAEAWIRKRVFESFEDSPAGHIAKLAGLLAPVAPGFEVSSDALSDCGVRPTKAEWSRFVSACDLVRSVDAESA